MIYIAIKFYILSFSVFVKKTLKINRIIKSTQKVESLNYNKNKIIFIDLFPLSILAEILLVNLRKQLIHSIIIILKVVEWKNLYN